MSLSSCWRDSGHMSQCRVRLTNLTNSENSFGILTVTWETIIWLLNCYLTLCDTVQISLEVPTKFDQLTKQFLKRVYWCSLLDSWESQTLSARPFQEQMKCLRVVHLCRHGRYVLNISNQLSPPRNAGNSLDCNDSGFQLAKNKQTNKQLVMSYKYNSKLLFLKCIYIYYIGSIYLRSRLRWHMFPSVSRVFFLAQ